MLDYEKKIWDLGFSLIVGCDEAGRGPLCGPVVCVAVILPPYYQNEEINDSKKLTEKKREKLFSIIKEDALDYSIQVISPKIIDEINIYEASRKGMIDAIKDLRTSPDYILTDAMPLYEFFGTPQEAIIKGDAKAMSIAAASILAKVTRDHIMMEYDQIYPDYHFAKHKGYPTKEHTEILEKLGPIENLYRFSYSPVSRFKKK